MGHFQLYLLSRSEFHHLFLSRSAGIFSCSKILRILLQGINVSWNGTELCWLRVGWFSLVVWLLKPQSVQCRMLFELRNTIHSVSKFYNSSSLLSPHLTYSLHSFWSCPHFFTGMMVKLLDVRRNKLDASLFYCVGLF
jgi:hypothetical protein